MNSHASRLSVLKIVLAGLLLVGTLTALQLLSHRAEPEASLETSQDASAHKTIPAFNVLVVGESSVVITNLAGWTREQAIVYLHEMKKARARGALASVGIPAPSTSKGYEEGVVYLIDGDPAPDLLAQFARKENPGYALIAPAVRGLYQWPSERLVVAFPNSTVLD